MMLSCRTNSILQDLQYTSAVKGSVYFFVYHNFSLVLITDAVHISEVQYTNTYIQKFPEFTMTRRVEFHAPKCTFNPDPIWDKKWNYLDPWKNVLAQKYDNDNNTIEGYS